MFIRIAYNGMSATLWGWFTLKHARATLYVTCQSITKTRCLYQSKLREDCQRKAILQNEYQRFKYTEVHDNEPLLVGIVNAQIKIFLGVYSTWYVIIHRTHLRKSKICFVKLSTINTKPLKPEQNGRHFEVDIFKCIFTNGNKCVFIKISMMFVT